ncbi:MAG: MFS transporter [Nitrospirales bacterium]
MKPILNSLRSGHWPSLFAAWLHFEVSFMAWLLVGALGVLIAEDFGLTASQKGLLVATPLLGGALLRILVGFCSDRFGTKKTGLILLIGESVVLLWGWLGATTYLEALGVGLLLGVAGASFAVALPLASRAYPPAHQGLAMGVAASGNSGVVLVAFFAPRLAETVGWHGVFGVMAVPVILTALVYAALVQREIGGPRLGEAWWPMVVQSLRRRSMYWLCFLYAVTFGGFVGLCSYLPIFFHDQYGLRPVTAGTVTAVCGLAGSLIRPLGGFVADRRGGALILRFLFPLIGVLTICVAQLPPFVWAAPLMVAILATLGFGNGVVFRVVSDHFPQEIGVAAGLIGAAGGLGGFVLPSLVGHFKDLTGSYAPGLLVLAVLALVAWTTVELVLRNRRELIKGVDPVDGVSH